MEFNSIIDYVTLFLLQYVPNGFIYILAGYALSKKPIDIKKYFLSSTILSIFGFTAKILSEMKLLNTSNTVPQILILFSCIFLLVNINQIKMVKAIISTLIMMILQLLVEGVYILLILKLFFNLDAQEVFDRSLIMQSIIGIPNQILLAIIILLFYKVMMKRRIQ